MPDISNFCGAVRKAAPNPTNWQFAERRENKAATKDTVPARASIKAGFLNSPCYSQIYGNCTSNAVLACDDYYYHNKKSWVPSTVFTYWVQRKLEGNLKGPDDGSSVEIALDAVRKYGACNSKVWPNDTSYKTKPTKAAFDDGLKGHEVTKYYNVKSLLQIKKALSNGYPVAASFTWPFNGVDSNYILKTPMSDKEIKKCETGHAVVIVGYDDFRLGGTFEIRNSWGPNWGNKGYCYISYEMAKKTIWFDDAYAVIK